MSAEPEPSGHDVVVIGASAGGVEALSTVVAELPGDAEIAVLVVLHIPASGTSVLPAILARRGDLETAHAVDGEPLERGRIYVAPPDRHLLVDCKVVRVSRGPKENGYRPAIDPLFRSAAHAYGGRVTGVILSGVLDDGTAGLSVIKRHGGRTLVQDPDDALYPMMPASAIEFVDPDRILPASEIAAAIMDASRERVAVRPVHTTDPILDAEDFIEIDRAASERPQEGHPTGFTCPDCGGVLWETVDGGVPRFRCRTGHGYSVETLLASQSEVVEGGMWSALRTLEERAAMTRRMAERFRSHGHRSTARRFERQADAAIEQALVIRRALQELAPNLVAEPELDAS